MTTITIDLVLDNNDKIDQGAALAAFQLRLDKINSHSNSLVEALYNNLAKSKIVEHVSRRVISEYTRRQYEACKDCIGDMTLSDFAAFSCNTNPNKSGIGQAAQIDILSQKKFPNIKGLPNHGKQSIKLTSVNGTLTVKECAGKSNLGGIKTFDAIVEEKNENILFVLKTVDLGVFSENEGGGHQDNVQDELARLISVIGSNKLVFKGKPVRVFILVDGRSSDEIVAYCRNIMVSGSIITMGNCEDI